MQTNALKPRTKRITSARVGRGGTRGKTSGRGMKGQNARSGRKKRPEMRDILKKLPKRRGHGKNRSRTVRTSRAVYAPVNLAALEKAFGAGDTVSPLTLRGKKLVGMRGGYILPVKILGTGTLSKKLAVVDCLASGSAKTAIIAKAAPYAMLSEFFRKLKLIFADEALRNRIFFLVGAIALFRFLAAIPIPGVNKIALDQFFAGNQFLGLLNIFSGGGFSNISLVLLGVGPYITASIFMQLMTVIFPKVKAMYTEEGEAGRTQFISVSRMITIPIAILQGVAFLSPLESQGILEPLSSFGFALNVFLVAAGSMLLMWIGELITEFGIGNGVSLIIFAGIIAAVPAGVSQLLFTATANIPTYLAFAAAALAVTWAIVVVSESERSIPIAYARQVRGQGGNTYLPIRLLQAGVIPLIFALSLLLPQMAFAGLAAVGIGWAAPATAWYAAFSANLFAYGIVYFLLVVMFTYFYTGITFEPKRVADNLQKSGAFIPGVRPGRETENYIGQVVNRITLPGAVFLGLVTVVPFIIQGITGITALLIGGTALLIAVQVLIDLIRKIEAQVTLREY